jgi:hypothetical protein
MISPDAEIPMTIEFYETNVKLIVDTLTVGDVVILSTMQPNTMRWFYCPANARAHVAVDYDKDNPAILITNIDIEIIDERYVFGAIEGLYEKEIFRFPFLDLGRSWTLSKAT